MHHRKRRARVVTHSVIVVSLMAASAVTFNAGHTTLYMEPAGAQQLAVGETADVAVRLASSVPVNAMSATLAFPPDLLQVVSISKEGSFLDLWTEETAIREETGEIHWSGGSTAHGGVTGTSTALTLRLKALRSGSAQMYFKDAQVLASDGAGTPVETVGTPFTYDIHAPGTAGGGSQTPPTMDFDHDNRIDIGDMSILLIHLGGTYDARYDLNRDGVLSIGDLSVMFTRMH